MTYTKLFNSILDSSIWQADDKTRIVWITMLAMADQHGEVHASVPGLAKRAGVSIDSTIQAIHLLSSPDEYSRTPDHEGRRIQSIDGGWEILNHAKYRRMASLDDRREQAAERQRRHRNELRVKPDQNTGQRDNALRSVTERDTPLHVTPCHAGVTLLDDKAEAEAEAEAEADTPTPPTPKTSSIPDGFSEFWAVYPRKVSKPGSLKSWRRLNPSPELQREIVDAVKRQSMSADWTKDGGQYIPHPQTYLNNRRWEDMLEAPETKESIREKLLAHRANPNHPNRINATKEDIDEYAKILARYKAMP